MGGGTSYSLVGKSVPLVSPLKYSIDYQRKIKDNLFLEFELKYTDKRYVSNDQENIEPMIPDYYLVNAKIRNEYGPYNFSLGIDNLFNKAYYDFAVSSTFHDDNHYGTQSVYPLPERNFYFDFKYTF